MIRLLSRAPITPGFGIGMRNSTTPHLLGRDEALANSPKSLSKVSKMRSSRVAHASTSGSLMPGPYSLPTRYHAQPQQAPRRLYRGNFRWQGSAYQAALGKTFSEL